MEPEKARAAIPQPKPTGCDLKDVLSLTWGLLGAIITAFGATFGGPVGWGVALAATLAAIALVQSLQHNFTLYKRC